MLHLWMPEANGVWQWSIGEKWQLATNLEQLIQDIQLYHGQDVTVFFPSRHIQILQQNLTKSQYKQLGADGIRYLLEEYTVLAVDTMLIKHHFQDAQITVLGIEKAQVETMQHALNLIPVQVVALLPDFLVLPVPVEQQQVLANIHGHLLVRSQEYVGNSIDDLALYMEYQDISQNYAISSLDDQDVERLKSKATEEQLSSFHYQFQPIKRAKQHPFNVLLASHKTTSSSGANGYWQALIAVVLLSVITQLSYDALRWYNMKKIADQTAQQAIEQYQNWFGRSGRITEQNLKSQFESQLRLNQNANTQALQMLSRVGPILMQQNIVAQQVDYQTETLTLSLKAHSSDVLQKLTQQLNQQGFKVELGNIQPNESGVIGMVKIQ